MRFISQLARISFLCFLCVLLLCLGVQGGMAAEAYKVGVLQPFSGVYSIYGEEAYAACEVAANQINAAGGVLGRKIELIKKDIQI